METKFDLENLPFAIEEIDKSKWDDGPWKNEPDSKIWVDEKTGYQCVIKRSSVTGTLRGYVGIKEGLCFLNKSHYLSNTDIEVHGGITYDKNYKEFRWVGFDCSHSGDLCPDKKFNLTCGEIFGAGGTRYRKFSYVVSEVEYLARQLKELEK